MISHDKGVKSTVGLSTLKVAGSEKDNWLLLKLTVGTGARGLTGRRLRLVFDSED